MQKQPSDHCYIVIQDHGPEQGGWGPAAVQMVGMSGPFVYTGSNEEIIGAFEQIAVRLAEVTGKPTLLAKFTQREDLLRIEGKKGELHAV